MSKTRKGAPLAGPLTTRKFTLTTIQAAWIASTAQLAGCRMSDLVGAAISLLQELTDAKDPRAIHWINQAYQYRRSVDKTRHP